MAAMTQTPDHEGVRRDGPRSPDWPPWRLVPSPAELARLARKLTAQVAVEAIAEHRADYQSETVAMVRAEATAAGVSTFYLSMIE